MKLIQEFKEFIEVTYDSPLHAVGEVVAWLGIVAFIVTATMIWG